MMAGESILTDEEFLLLEVNYRFPRIWMLAVYVPTTQLAAAPVIVPTEGIPPVRPSAV
jgi:hypothetical protein